MLKTNAVLASLASIAAVAIAVPAADAGKPSRGGDPTTSIALAPGSENPSWNDVIRFTVTTSATAEPFVNLKCSQGGTVVADGWEGYFERSINDGDFQLASPQWTGGAADCTASVAKYTKRGWQVLGSMSFHVTA